MTQIKDITDEMIYAAIEQSRSTTNKFPYDFIDAPVKVVLTKMKKMVEQGKLDYGVSLRTAWRKNY